MSQRKEYEMSEQDLKDIINTCKPVSTWMALGRKMGFDWNTVWSVPEKGERIFTAIPLDTSEKKEGGK